MARVHRLEHVERLGAADLADDDPVGAHAQAVADEVADRDLALALDVRRARLEPQRVALVELELGGVLDRDDAVVVRDRLGEDVQERRLSGAGTARDEDVQARLDAALEELDRLGRQRPEPDHVLEAEPVAGELPDRDERPGERERRDDRVDAAAVGEARVDHRRRLVDAAADLRHDLVQDPAQVRLVVEPDARLVELALALDPDVVGPVDHDLADGVVGEQPLERAVAEDVVGEVGRDLVALGAREAASPASGGGGCRRRRARAASPGPCSR